MPKYSKTNWIDGETILKAEHMQKIEQGIVDLCDEINGLDQYGGISLRDIEEGEIFEVDVPIVVYGNIITSTNSLTVDENATTTFAIKLDQEPTNSQIINISINNGYCNIDKTRLTFDSNNYDMPQTITVAGVHDVADYLDKTSNIVISSDNISSKTVSVTIKNIDEMTGGEETPPEVIPENHNNISVVTIGEEQYYHIKDISYIKSAAAGSIFGATSYKNDKYQVYSFSLNQINKDIFDFEGQELFNGFIKKSNATGSNSLLTDANEGDLYTIVNGNVQIRLPFGLNGYSDVYEYLKNKYGEFYIKKNVACNEKIIDSSFITSISVKLNNSDTQYAQFGYSDLPTSNIYSGICSLGFNTGANANLTNSGHTPTACMSTTTLSIRFKPNTFKDFTLDNVKKFLEKNILTFWYY